MKTAFLKKTLVTGIFLLFIGTGIVSGFHTNSTINSQPISRGWFFVGGSGPGNYSTIQSAINAASSGDTVFVFNGTYFGHININKSINLIGQDKNTTFIIGFFAYTLSIISDWVNMSGFTIQYDGRLGEGVRIDSCYNNFINNIIDMPNERIRLFGDSNTISGNTIKGAYINVIGDSNTISVNTITNNDYGIYLTGTCDNIISNNSFFNSGLFISDDIVWNNIVTNNTVNDKPLVYVEDESDLMLDIDAGQIILVNCTNITIKNQEIFNTTVGIQIWGSNSCVISDNTLMGNYYGIFLCGWNSTINDNTITNNDYGIWLEKGLDNNTIYHSNLINNEQNAYDVNRNIWYNAELHEGNYWSDYTGIDGNGDGIGDTPYNISGGNNQDLYPFMEPNGWLNEPPNTPLINGPSWGVTNVNYSFCITVMNPDGDSLYCLWNFGDSNDSEWLGPFSSGETICVSHAWSHKGTYEITVLLKDEYGEYSNWSHHMFNVYELKNAFIFGKITNLSTQEDYITFEAVKARAVTFSPFNYKPYVSGEKFTISKDYRGLVGAWYIFALCKIPI